MMLASFDFETELIAPGYQAPAPVCMTLAFESNPDDASIYLAHESDCAETLRNLFDLAACRRVVLVGSNIAFDVCVAARWGMLDWHSILAAYDAGGILDLAACQRLAEIGAATQRTDLGLASLARLYGIPNVDKEGTEPDGTPTRLSYGALRGLPLDRYSETQLRYALLDATAGVRVGMRMRDRWIDTGRIRVDDWAELSRKLLWLRVIANEGMNTDPDRVGDLETLTHERVATLADIARGAGFVRVGGRDAGSRDMAAIRARVSSAYDDAPPMTEAPRNRTSVKPFIPNIRTDKGTLADSGDPLLESLAEYGEWLAIENKDLEYLRKPIIHTKFGIADTTRVTSSKPNLQNLRRQSKQRCVSCGLVADTRIRACPSCGGSGWVFLGGVRECFTAPPGRVLVACDHSGLELCTLAQCCVSLLGRVDMAGKINRGEDLHSHVGASIVGMSYDDFLARKDQPEISNARNAAKIVNFGCPGGMAAATLVVYAKQSYGITIDLAFAERLVRAWEEANPDGRAFLQYVRRLRNGDRYDVTIPGSTIARRQITYTAACNTHFQGLGTIVESIVGWEILRACRAGEGWLSLCDPVMFIHDEFILSSPLGTESFVANELESIMVTAARAKLPDVTVRAEASAMLRWSKRAKSKWIDAPGDPRAIEATGKRLAVWGQDYE